MATYEFTLPDGRVVEVSSDGDMTMDQAVAAFQQMQATEPAQQGPTREQLEAELAQNQAASLEAQRNLDSAERLRPVANALGVFEPIASMASGAANTVLGGLAGLDAALDPRQAEGAGAAAVERFADRTYQPVTDTGQAVMQTVAAPFQWYGQKADDAGQIVSGTTGSPLLGAAMRTLIEAAPELVGARGVGSAARRAGTRPPLQPPQPAPPVSDSAALARAAGLEVRPSDVRAADPGVRFPGIVPERLVESIAGSDRLRYDMTLRNQPRNTATAARAIGAPEGAALTPETFQQLRAPQSAVYDQVAQTIGDFTPTAELQRALDNIATSLPEAASPAAAAEINRLAGTFSYPTTGQGVLNAIADLRQRARANSRPSDGARAEVNEDIARAQRQIAEALESEMERQLTLAPRIEGAAPAVTADQFRAARQALARIHDVEDATVAGQVDVGRLRRARDRGAPLSGELAMLADLAEMYPNVTRHPQSFTSPPSTGDLLSGTLRSVGPGFLARRYLQGGFQQRLGAVGDESILSRYAPEPARPANLSGELGLVQDALPVELTLADDLGLRTGPRRNPRGSR